MAARHGDGLDGGEGPGPAQAEVAEVDGLAARGRRDLVPAAALPARRRTGQGRDQRARHPRRDRGAVEAVGDLDRGDRLVDRGQRRHRPIRGPQSPSAPNPPTALTRQRPLRRAADSCSSYSARTKPGSIATSR
jgi:hypothetical protein